ncbi:ADP-ribosyltransferase [Emticicia fluvialis]|uniref:ADP-ribosyltransferase n=1 Tax=Emticicia fluvialis TaxID=2974474 RepID=UPI00216633B1|nr:ADP-ribosyltransferase [Emticicia fluvialis]
MTLEEFANEYLEKEIRIVERFSNEYPFLSIHEKAVIYKYTEDGYESLNEQLRVSNGLNISEFGVHLKNALDKIPSEFNLAFRGVNLNKSQLKSYLEAYHSGELIGEHSFISASLNENLAWAFGRVRFTILSRNWKNISIIAKHLDEKEVVLCYNKKFKVLSYDSENGYYEITLEEVTLTED